MPAADSSYLTIHNKLVDIYEMITTAGGYNYNVQKVYKGFLDIKKETDFPAIAIARGPERKVLSDEGGELHWVTATFGVQGLVQFESNTSDDDAANDAMDKFITDMQRVILANESLLYGGNTPAKSVLIAEVMPLFIDGKNKGYVEIILVIEYAHDSNL